MQVLKSLPVQCMSLAYCLMLAASNSIHADDCESPTYNWGGLVSGEGWNYAYEVAFDSEENLYLIGTFNNIADIDPTAGVDLRSVQALSQSCDLLDPGTDPESDVELFIVRLNADGTYAWGRTIGGGCSNAGVSMSAEFVFSIDVDNNDDVYFCGWYGSSDGFYTVDFDPTGGIDEHVSFGVDFYATKLNADGSYGWTYTTNSSDTQQARGIAVLPSGETIVLGLFRGVVDFDPGPGTDQRISSGNYDIFVVRLNADGSYSSVQTFGGSGFDIAHGITVDSTGNTYIAGRFDGTVDFDPTSGGVDQRTSNGGADRFLCKYNSMGSYLWTRTIGNSGDELSVHRLAATDDAVYLTSYFAGTLDFDPSPGGVDNRTVSSDLFDSFIWKILADGSYGWTAVIEITSGSGNSLGRGIAIAANGDLLATGTFLGTVDFDPTAGVDDHDSGQEHAAYVTRLSADGTYRWTASFPTGSDAKGEGNAIAVNSFGDVAMAGDVNRGGATGSFVVDLDPSAEVDEHTVPDRGDGFVVMLNCPHSMTCPADLDGDDGEVNVFDLFVLLSNWNNNGPGADLAEPTNIVDVFDLFALLSAWGSCQ